MEARMTDNEFLTSKECARYRRCSERKVERERSEGCGPDFIKDGRKILYRKGDIDRFLAAHRHLGELRDQG
jgi:hypothetical protein